MKKIFLASGMLLSTLTFANNQQCSGKVLSVNEVKAELTKQGYTKIKEVKYDDCIYEVEATNPSGDKVDLDFDPNSGKVVSEEKDRF